MTGRLRIFDSTAEAHDAIAALGDTDLFVYPYTERLYLVVRKEGDTVSALTTTGAFFPASEWED